MKKYLTLLFLITYSLASGFFSAQSAPMPPDPVLTVEPADDIGLPEKILQEAQKKLLNVGLFQPYDINVEMRWIAPDLSWAAAWLIPVHPQTGEIIPSEPGLALARNVDGQWQIALPGEPEWIEGLNLAPTDWMSDEEKILLQPESQIQSTQQITTALTGYRLPWEAGKTVYLSGSTYHDSYITSGTAHYSFDFYVPQTMFNIHAAKAGTVWAYYDAWPNGYADAPNYLVLEDKTTSPTTYQLYLHLAQYSIPPELKIIGTPVVRGQFIGIADDTGMSTGHHLHFQIQTLPYWNSYWGQSVDIVFEDVNINGGRPRITADFPYCDWPGDVCVTAQTAYISNNIFSGDTVLPWGDLTAPIPESILQSQMLNISGWAADNQQVSSIKIKAFFNNTWNTIGPTYSTTSFSYDWDTCASSVPDGPISLALEIRDQAGNLAAGLPGLRHLVKNYSCPTTPPPCNPTVDQVALFSEPDYQGTCVTLGVGSYPYTSFGSVGNNNTASLKIGNNVRLTLFNNSDYTGRGQSFETSDSSLIDNWIGNDSTSSAKVNLRTNAPTTPQPIWPPDGVSLGLSPTMNLSWDNRGNALQFQVKLNNQDLSWQPGINQILGSLNIGTYTWQIRSRNVTGDSAWSTARTFTVTSNLPVTSPVTAPFSDGMENGSNGWSNSSNWDQSLADNHTTGGSIIWAYEVASATSGYDNGQANYGDLTSPSIYLPTTGYTLQFWYKYETESDQSNWDQRWVQISVNGSPFSNLVQLYDDPANTWLLSPSINLDDFTGNNIRIRLHFSTIDAALNGFKGWYIDDFSIFSTSSPTCSESADPDSTPGQARQLLANSSVNAEICPGGDIDYFYFDVAAGNRIGISTRSQIDGSPLDTYLYLLDSDGKSILVMNDDQQAGSRTDSYISYPITRSGTYYVKVRAWDHPSAGGINYDYTLNLYSSGLTQPTISILSPPGHTFLPATGATISALANDTQSGISRTEFFWHSGDWSSGVWNYLGTDWEGVDGWTSYLDTATLTEQQEMAVYAHTYDWVGNQNGAASWNLWLDRTAPVSALSSLPSSQDSTAFRLQWSGSDNLIGIGHYDIQTFNASVWNDLLTNVPEDQTSAWYIGQAGGQYSFRLRAVDKAGNIEPYPTIPEAVTSIPTDFCSAGDTFENDNSALSATIVSEINNQQIHTFCNPISGSGWLNDQDWIRYTVKAGQTMFVLASAMESAAAPSLSLYAANGTTLLAQSQPPGVGMGSVLMYHSPSDQTVYLRITHLDGRIAGDAVRYRLVLTQGQADFLPYVNR